jgi:RimJ/RimL family protein N-acetyltransferase
MELRFLRLKLVKVTPAHLELLRNWRNEDVRNFMIYREYITPGMQQEWFSRIQNMHNFYFVIYDGTEPVGLIDIKQINWQERSADSGIFIAPVSARFGDVSVISSIMSAAFMTQVLKLKKIYGKVLAENKQAIAFNLSNGFKVLRRDSEVVYMGIEDTDLAFPGIIEQKRKLCHLYKVPETEPIQLLIRNEDIRKDSATRWLTNELIRLYFPGFKYGEPVNIL